MLNSRGSSWGVPVLLQPLLGDLIWPGCVLTSPPLKWPLPNRLGAQVCVSPHSDLLGGVVGFWGALISGRTPAVAGASWHIASPPSQHLEISETHAAKPRLKKLLVVQEHLLDGGEREAFHSSFQFGAIQAPLTGAGALPAPPCKGTLKARGSGYLDTPSIRAFYSSSL